LKSQYKVVAIAIILLVLSISAWALCKRAKAGRMHTRTDTLCHCTPFCYCDDDYDIQGGCFTPLDQKNKCVDDSFYANRNIYYPQWDDNHWNCTCTWQEAENTLVNSAHSGPCCPP
jgi:hypothetical protein